MDAAAEFAAVAVTWSAKGGASYTLDTRPEATLWLGFFPNEQAITPRGLATVIGVNVDGHLFFELIRSSEVVHFTYTTKEEYDDKVALKPGFRAIRTDAEKAFVAVAVEWTAMSGDVFVVDTRLEALHRFGLRPNERAITPVGLATIVGVSIDGRLLITVVRNSYPIAFILPFVLTNENVQLFTFRPICTVEDRAFAAVAVEWIDKSTDRHLLDTRPGGALLPLGFAHNEQVITPAGIATVIGVNIDGKLVFEVVSTSKVVQFPHVSKEGFEEAGFRAIRTDTEKAFVAVAAEWTTKDGFICVIDTRSESTGAFGFFPNEQVITSAGLATVIGVNIDGQVLFEVISSSTAVYYGYPKTEDFEADGFRAIRTDEEKHFVARAVEWKCKHGTILLLDTRPEAALSLSGFSPNELVITPDGPATVLGVNIGGFLNFEMLHDDSDPVQFFTHTTSAAFEQAGFRAVRSANEKQFLAAAVRWVSRSGGVYTLDTRPQSSTRLGIDPGDRVVTINGLATVIGITVDGFPALELVAPDSTGRAKPLILCPHTTLEELRQNNYFPIRTEAERAFLAVAVERTAKDGIIDTVDVRPEATLAFGFYPNERVLTTVGLATIIGVNIIGILLVEVIKTLQTLTLPPGTRWEEGLEGCAVIPIRTAAQKAFVAAAKEHPGGRHGTPVVLLDSRPQTLNRIGFSDPNERFYSQDAQGLAGFQIVGVDIRGNTYFKLFGLLEVVCLKYTTRAECLAGGLISLSRTRAPVLRPSVPAPHRPALAARPAAAVAPVVPPTVRVPAPVKTVTLPSGVMYTGAHTRAGQRHGNGTMRGADRSWRYKGQWQQGRPHGSGVLRMTIELGRGISTEAVFEGRWVLGVPHGRGTLRVESVSEERRYRGRWAHGWRAMTAAEVAAVRLSGGTALLCHRPVRTVPAKSDTSKKNVNKTKKKAASAAPTRTPAAVVFATHDEVQRMIAVVAAACAPATGAMGESGNKRFHQLTITTTSVAVSGVNTSLPQATIKLHSSPPKSMNTSPAADAEILFRSRTGVLRQFLLH